MLAISVFERHIVHGLWDKQTQGKGFWFSSSISLYLKLLYVGACLQACRDDKREDLSLQGAGLKGIYISFLVI